MSEFTPVLLTLPSFTPSLALEVLPHGVTLHRLFVQADGRTHDILIGPEDPKGHLQQKYTNTIVGRYANRLPVDPSSPSISRNGLTSSFVALPNEKPHVSLHGGPKGFDSHVWTPLLDPSESQLFTQAEIATIGSELQPPTAVIFSRVSEDGEEGFPGKLRVEVLVALASPRGKADENGEVIKLGSVILIYRARLEEEGKVTPINLTQHWGFNLDASLQDGAPSVKEHKLSIQADHTIGLDDSALSTGELLPAEGTHHAHAEKKTGKIGERFPAQGYDEFYLFSRPASTVPARLPSASFADVNVVQDVLNLRPNATNAPVVLESEKSGLTVLFETNQSGVQFYSNNLTNPTKNARKKIHGGPGEFGVDGYDVGSAAFLEFHEPLAAWLHPTTQGASKDDTLLASGEVYNNFVRLDVVYKAP